MLAGHCGDVRRDTRDTRKSLVLGAVIGGTEANVRQMELFAQKVARSSEAQRPVSWRRSDRREDRSSC